MLEQTTNPGGGVDAGNTAAVDTGSQASTSDGLDTGDKTQARVEPEDDFGLSDDDFPDDQSGTDDGEAEDGLGNDNPDQPDASKELKATEIEYEGKKYKVPPELKDAFLRNADYTRKTQALSQEKKTLEAQKSEQTTHLQAVQANIREYAQVLGMQEQLAAYENVDWDTFAAQDPDRANAEWRKYSLLKDRHDRTEKELDGKVRQLTEKERQSAHERRTKAIDARDTVLKEKIPGINKELGEKLVRFGGNRYGFSQEEIAGTEDPRLIIALHDAYLGAIARKTATKAKNLQQQSQARPVPQLRTKGAPATKDPNKMTTAQYLKWRESGGGND